MTDAIKHRGPDGEGYLSCGVLGTQAGESHFSSERPGSTEAGVWFGHRRLSIIDITGSAQPLCNEDRTVWVTYNGEIYNFPELRSQLKKKGHTFKTEGDTEVLVHLWEEYGAELLEHLVGMFAFAIYDRKTNVLFLARDRFGQKPLYYFESEQMLAFASELQGLWPVPQFQRHSMDEVAVAQYFRYGYVPSPRTIYEDVKPLPPGHFALYSNGELKVQRYWSPNVHGIHSVSSEELESVFDDSVRLRMRADVPLGAFLSGGIDSSLIVSSMARQSSNSIQTFTISSDEPGVDESAVAAETARVLRTQHSTFRITPDIVEVSQKLAQHYGQPFADYSSLPTYYVSRETRKKVSVAISGDGGDELFGGYERYRNAGLGRWVGQFPYVLRKESLRLGSPYADFLLTASDPLGKGENLSSHYHSHWRKTVFTEEFQNFLNQKQVQKDTARFEQYFKRAQSGNPTERWMEVDQQMYLPDDILTKVDIASMSVGLETRSPFLDHRIAELSNRMLLSQKIRRVNPLGRGVSKWALRELAKNRLPKGVLSQPKKGFTLPLGTWMRGFLKDWTFEHLHSPSLAPYVQTARVNNLWREHQSGKWDHSMRLWSLVCWSLWQTARNRGQR